VAHTVFCPPSSTPGERTTYERFAAYVPRGEGIASYSGGPKVTHFDRVEWRSAGDPATAVAALLQGEVDWLDSPNADHVPLLKRNDGVTVEITEPSGSIPLLRFNHLHPPFNNPAVRRAVLGAIDQSGGYERRGRHRSNLVAGPDRSVLSWISPGQRGRDRGPERSPRLR